MDNLYGLEEKEEIEVAILSGEKSVINIQSKKRMFFYWEVGGESHKLKLSTAMICRLENKYKTNLMNLLDDLPPLSVMLTIIQGAATEWKHEVKLEHVQGWYDKYVDEGGSQIKLFTDVVMQIMAVSGFFTQEQAETITKGLKEANNLL